MPMPREEHELILEELLNPATETSRKTELLQNLRADYGTVIADVEKFTADTARMKTENEDLVISNSRLFRQVGIVDDPKKKEKEDEKTFSETVTLESLEN